eukprot:3939096-Rhodomonas_salina.1
MRSFDALVTHHPQCCCVCGSSARVQRCLDSDSSLVPTQRTNLLVMDQLIAQLSSAEIHIGAVGTGSSAQIEAQH